MQFPHRAAWTAWIAALVILLNLPLTFLGYAQQPTAPSYAAHGPYAVGTREFTIADPTRPLAVTVWYPALNPSNTTENATYSLNFVVHVTGHAIQNAQPDTHQAPYPLVIFSHGSGTSRLLSLFLTEHLASYGFVVIAADHPGNTILDTLQAESFKAAIIPNFADRPLDVLREIAFAETLTSRPGALEGIIDVNHAAVIGHSFGGYTALAAAGARLDFAALNAWCDDPANADLDPYRDTPMYPSPTSPHTTYGACFMRDQAPSIAKLRGLAAVPDGLFPATTDSRIKAVVALAPWDAPIFGANGLAALTIPAMVMVGSADHVTPPQRDADAVYLNLASHPKSLVTFQDADHYIFIDECPEFLKTFDAEWACTDPAWDMPHAHNLINHFATAFLLATLKQDAAAAQVLTPDAVDLTGIDYTWEK